MRFKSFLRGFFLFSTLSTFYKITSAKRYKTMLKQDIYNKD
jgi:hypothetical protein